MREIKFRAWDYKNDEMRGWDDIGSNWDLGIVFNNSNSMNCEVMQYTGLKDKNGKEIFEGDIVNATAKLQGFIMCVIWDEQDAGWRVNYYNGTKSVQDWLCMYRELEVIGNIYENPELLNGR